MSVRDLPSEMQKTIREFGYNPFISDADMYSMICDINPYYSLRDILIRLGDWTNIYSMLKENYPADMKIFEGQIHDKATIMKFGDQWDVTTHDKKRWSINGDDLYVTVNGIKNKMGNILHITQIAMHTSRYPLSPSIITTESPNKYLYEHFQPITYYLPTYEPFDPKVYAAIQNIQPNFSLNKEYNRLVSHQSSIRNIKLKGWDLFFNLIATHIHLVEYDEGDIRIDLKSSLTNHMLSLLPPDIRSDSISSLSIDRQSMSDYISLISYLWTGTSSLETDFYYAPMFAVPFVNT